MTPKAKRRQLSLPPMGVREFIALMALLMSVVAMTIDALLPALGAIGEEFGVANPNHVQYVVSFMFLGMALGQLGWGPLSDAWGRKRTLYLTVALYLAGSVACLLASSFPGLLAGRLVQGLGAAGPYVTTVSIVRDRYAGRDMARIMSISMMIFLLVPALAPSVGQAILWVAPWQAIFVLYIAYALVITGWLWARMEETLPPARRIPFSLGRLAATGREVATHRATLTYTACMGICFGSFMGYLNTCQQIFQNQFGVGAMFPAYFGMLALAMGASSLLNARLVRQVGMRALAMRAFGGVIMASGVFLAVQTVAEVQLWMFLLYAASLFFAMGLVFGNLNALAMEPMGHIAGTASAVIGSLSSALSMSLGITIGQLYNNTLTPIVGGFLVLGAAALGLMLGAEKNGAPRQA